MHRGRKLGELNPDSWEVEYPLLKSVNEEVMAHMEIEPISL